MYRYLTMRVYVCIHNYANVVIISFHKGDERTSRKDSPGTKN